METVKYLDEKTDKLVYSNKFISYIFHNNELYFKAKEVAELLEYENTTDAIIKNVDDEYVYTVEDLRSQGCSFPSNTKSNTKYITESGLYALTLNSKKKEAKQFRKWILEDILPNIRKTGKYDVKDTLENSKLLEEINKLKEIEELKNKEILKLKEEKDKRRTDFTFNKHLKNLETVYIASSEYNLNKNIFKVGGTTNLSNRIPSYNTGRLAEDKFFVLKEFKTYSYKLVEWTVSKYLNDFKVKGTKELYNIPLKNLIEIMDCIISKLDEVTYSFNNSLNNIFDNLEHLSLESKELGTVIFERCKNSNDFYMYAEEIKNNNNAWYYNRYKK